MRLAARHAEDVREVGAVESVPQVQLADLPVHRVQPGQRGAYLAVEFRLLGANRERPRVIHRVGRLIQPR